MEHPISPFSPQREGNTCVITVSVLCDVAFIIIIIIIAQVYSTSLEDMSFIDSFTFSLEFYWAMRYPKINWIHKISS